MIIKSGILCEGTSDYSIIGLILLDRLVARSNHKLDMVQSLSVPVNGPITREHVRLRTGMFIAQSISVGFYFADQDRCPYDKQLKIKEWIEQKDENWINHSVIAVPKPHMEAWLLADEDTVKHILRLDATKPLPHPKKEPKDRLMMLVKDSSDEGLTASEVRTQLAASMNLDIVISKMPEFRALDRRLSQVIIELSR